MYQECMLYQYQVDYLTVQSEISDHKESLIDPEIRVRKAERIISDSG